MSNNINNSNRFLRLNQQIQTNKVNQKNEEETQSSSQTNEEINETNSQKEFQERGNEFLNSMEYIAMRSKNSVRKNPRAKNNASRMASSGQHAINLSRNLRTAPKPNDVSMVDFALDEAYSYASGNSNSDKTTATTETGNNNPVYHTDAIPEGGTIPLNGDKVVAALNAYIPQDPVEGKPDTNEEEYIDPEMDLAVHDSILGSIDYDNLTKQLDEAIESLKGLNEQWNTTSLYLNNLMLNIEENLESQIMS